MAQERGNSVKKTMGTPVAKSAKTGGLKATTSHANGAAKSAAAKRAAKGATAAKKAATESTTSAGGSWRPEARARFVTEMAGGTRRAADLLEVAASQPSRWATGESVPGPVQARMLVDIDHVFAHALLVWADAGVARDWLTTANSHLDGVRPVDWIRLHGTAEVVEALRAEAAGAYT